MTFKFTINPVLAAVILIAAMFIIPVRCSQATESGDEYRWVATEAAWQILNYADWMQTRQIARDPDRYREHNPILGDHPSLEAVNVYMVVGSAAHLAASYYIPEVMQAAGAPDSWVKNSRAVFQYVTIGLTAGCVANNYAIGLRVSF